VLAYHGTSRAIANRILRNSRIEASENDYDWLGHGTYFWEANPARALQFAREKQIRNPDFGEPTVLGAAIDLGYCLDLLTTAGTTAVDDAFQDFEHYCKVALIALPANHGGRDSIFRALDCAVVNHLHKIREDNGLQRFDTVKAPFWEGGEIYPGSGFSRKSHIQICVRNPECIKGIFRLKRTDLNEAAEALDHP
jgi:hypothetical protein